MFGAQNKRCRAFISVRLQNKSFNFLMRCAAFQAWGSARGLNNLWTPCVQTSLWAVRTFFSCSWIYKSLGMIIFYSPQNLRVVTGAKFFRKERTCTILRITELTMNAETKPGAWCPRICQQTSMIALWIHSIHPPIEIPIRGKETQITTPRELDLLHHLTSAEQ